MQDGRDMTRTGTRSSSPAWLTGPLATGLGWAAHVASGGQSPAVLIVAALAALLGMAAAMVGPRQLPAWAVLVAAGLAQQFLHLAFAALAISNGVPVPEHGHLGSPEVSPAEPGVAGPGTAEPGAAEPGAPAGPHTLHLMLHLHMGAALVTLAVVTQWNKLGRLARAFPGRREERAARE